MADDQPVILSKSFAVDIIRLCETLRERKKPPALPSSAGSLNERKIGYRRKI